MIIHHPLDHDHCSTRLSNSSPAANNFHQSIKNPHPDEFPSCKSVSQPHYFSSTIKPKSSNQLVMDEKPILWLLLSISKGSEGNFVKLLFFQIQTPKHSRSTPLSNLISDELPSSRFLAITSTQNSHHSVLTHLCQIYKNKPNIY